MTESFDTRGLKYQFRSEKDLLKILRRWPIRDYIVTADTHLRWLFGTDFNRQSQFAIMASALVENKNEFESMWIPKVEFVKNIQQWADKKGFFVKTFDYEYNLSPNITFRMKNIPEMNLDTLANIIEDEIKIILKKEPNVTNRLPAELWYLDRKDIEGKFLYLHDEARIGFKDFFDMVKMKIDFLLKHKGIDFSCEVLSELDDTYNCLIVKLNS